jgi:hypothetical protein
MKKMLMLPSILLLSALFGCGDDHCADKATTQGKKPVKVEKATTKKSGKWLMFRKQGIALDTQSGKYKDVKCFYKEPTEKKKASVFCKRTLKDVDAREYHVGTRRDAFENTIGIYTKGADKNVPGKGTVVVVCDGPCKEIDKTKVQVID